MKNNAKNIVNALARLLRPTPPGRMPVVRGIAPEEDVRGIAFDAIYPGLVSRHLQGYGSAQVQHQNKPERNGVLYYHMQFEAFEEELAYEDALSTLRFLAAKTADDMMSEVVSSIEHNFTLSPGSPVPGFLPEGMVAGFAINEEEHTLILTCRMPDLIEALDGLCTPIGIQHRGDITIVMAIYEEGVNVDWLRGEIYRNVQRIKKDVNKLGDAFDVWRER